MKNNRSLINGLVAGVMALAMASTLTAQTVTQVKARVVRIKGYARFTTGNNVWQNLKVGEALRAGTIIQTGLEKGSFVDLVLGDGSAEDREDEYATEQDGDETLHLDVLPLDSEKIDVLDGIERGRRFHEQSLAEPDHHAKRGIQNVVRPRSERHCPSGGRRGRRVLERERRGSGGCHLRISLHLAADDLDGTLGIENRTGLLQAIR